MNVTEELKKALNISGDFSTEELLKMASDKYAFYQNLVQNAPNDYLKKIQIKNRDEIQILVGKISNATEPKAGYKPENSFNEKSQSKKTNSNEESVALLIVHTENQKSQSFDLREGKTVIGRFIDENINKIELANDQYISRLHTIINISGNNCEIGDAGSFGFKASTNGVYINGFPKRLVGILNLNDGDTIQIGNTKLVFKWLNSSKSKIENEVRHTNYVNTVIINII